MLQTLTSWLYSIAGSLAAKVLISLGFGALSLSTLGYLKNQLEQIIDNQLNNIWSNVYQVIAITGFIDAIGIWLGAITTAITFLSLKKLALISQ